LNSLLFGTYAASAGGIIYNIIKLRLMDDLEKEIRALREYDFDYEKMDKELFN